MKRLILAVLMLPVATWACTRLKPMVTQALRARSVPTELETAP